VQVAGATLFAALVVMGPAVATSAEASVSVIPGGPPIATGGAYNGTGIETAAFCGFGGRIGFQLDSSGTFTNHPTLGNGTYEFHVGWCVSLGPGVHLNSPGGGSFVITSTPRSFSGTVQVQSRSSDDGTLNYSYWLTATGACKAFFEADGQDVFETEGLPAPFVESGILEQFGAVVCTLERG
jgi:hypothetical protein